METTARDERAWAAGFFDGEGCATINESRPGYFALRLAVTQTDIETLERFHRAVDGLGRLYGPYQPAASSKKPQYAWRTQAREEVQAVIDILWTFLSEPKRRQIVTKKKEVDEQMKGRRQYKARTEVTPLGV